MQLSALGLGHQLILPNQSTKTSLMRYNMNTDICVNYKEIHMKSVLFAVVSLFAVGAFAAEPAKAPEVKVEAKKEAAKPAPAKSDAKAEKKDSAKPAAPKADVKAADPAKK